ncbi:hypothetical protein WG68_07905 [Arsukibacterium ikkense]|uniref:histidine kinase n=1 Tax=Arsukibacterium ikkense TaxID=336831 RepID=A0A0M2V8D6_9GAMM|nr:HAMP domain-containing sensor histidine kinase [Arsukibacterium ikkense]KKO45925.1 hypothetical protein WG68_07905 [Arsukibacterium ikkense]
MQSLYLPLYLVICFSSLTVLLGLSLLALLGWSNLAVATLLFIVCWPLAALWYWLYLKIKLPLQQSVIYCQSLNEDAACFQLNPQQLPHAYQQLLQEIKQLAQPPPHRDQSLLLTLVAQQLPFPLLVFDQAETLLFANNAASHALKLPLILGSKATALGFTAQPALNHPSLIQDWQQQTIQQKNGELVFYALDLRHPLYQQQKQSQRQLIRVLSHELRNSLTPMASMTETLLSQVQLPEQQSRLVLNRIKARSQRLLTFIDQYAQLQQLPASKPEWCDLKEILDELQLTCSIPLQHTGATNCYADPYQLRQLLLNLARNAAQACQNLPDAILQVAAYCQGQQQILQVSDNGPGFANLENLFTPFYTTKANGSGIGLMLCQEIVMQHAGSIEARNLQNGGAELVIRWPLPD